MVMKKRQKTNVQSNILLLDVPKMILDKYKGMFLDDKVLPVPSNQKMNAYLKEIGDICGIEKSLSCHLARHSNYSFLLKINDLQAREFRQVTI